MELKFRDLRADEIECRVGTQTEKGISLLLYKDARCDMNILDETVGALNWQRRHTRDNANCIVSIWDAEKNQWIEKEDTGTESKTEAEKGLASDSFKRACVNIGIGRELYTSPFIWISRGDYSESAGRDGKARVTDKFTVSRIQIENKTIIDLELKNKQGKVVFSMGGRPAAPKQKASTKAEERVKGKMIDKIRQLDGAIHEAIPHGEQNYLEYCYDKANLDYTTPLDELPVAGLEKIGDLMTILYKKAQLSTQTQEG